MEEIFELSFPNGHRAKTVRVHRQSDLNRVLSDLGVAIATPTLVLVGGASGISEGTMGQLHSFFNHTLAPVVQAMGLVVIDGGTDAGIMRLMGQARRQLEGSFPLIGIAAVGTVILPDLPRPQDGADLEPNHTHVVLVPGSLWGDESPWIARVATAIAQAQPSLTLLVNGGTISFQDVANSIRARRPVLVLAGSGRAADELAAAIRGDRSSPRAMRLLESGLLQIAELEADGETVAQQIKQLLSAHVHP